METFASNTRPAFSKHTLAKDGSEEAPRQFADFHSTTWGDYFINNPPPLDPNSDSWIKQRIRELVDRVKMMLSNITDWTDKMHMIDVLQRLGISYHFTPEISEILSQLSKAPVDSDELRIVALQFRLLRQNRHYAPSDVFNQFKDDEGKFKASLSSDVKGLLSLYEAAYFGTPGEDILDEAISFTRLLLKSMVEDLPPNFKALVSSALEAPMARKMNRIGAKEYILIYENHEEMRNDVVLELAKLDFYLLQLMYRQEIRNICMWWKELDLVKKLGYARDRIVESYMWVLAAYHEPQYSWGRDFFGKMIGIFSLCDDTFDVYGTPDELKKFTDAIIRWDIEAADEMPEYMRLLFRAMLKYSTDVENELALQGKAYGMHYVKKMTKELICNYLKESKWAYQGYVPTLEEHLRVSLITSAYPVLTCVSYVGMGEEANKEAFEWLASFPKILEASSIICRIYNDIASHQIEQKRIHVASTVECYVKEHGVSTQEAYKKLQEMLENAWRTLNEEYLRLNDISTSLVIPMINLAHATLAIYEYFDTYTDSSTLMREKIESMFVRLLPI